MKKFHSAIRIIGIVVFVVILFRINLSKCLSMIRQVDYLWLVPIVFVHVLVIFLKSLRWQVILKGQGINISIGELFLTYYGTYCLGTFTPMRLGDMLKFSLVNAKGYSVSEAVLGAALDKFFDIAMAVLCGIVAVFYFANVIHFRINAALLVTVVIAGGCLAFFLFGPSNFRRWLLTIWDRLRSNRYIDKVHKFIVDLFAEFKKCGIKKILPKLLLLSFCAQLLLFLIYYLVVKLLGFTLGFWEINWAMSLTLLATTLPITLLGIGIREASLIFLFGCFKLSSENAVLYAWAILMVMLVLSLPSSVVLIFHRMGAGTAAAGKKRIRN